ncbi:MAG: hypothetical protein GHCLOJNM_03082 [bacterium]|nr:hypothetical protein [bacterium]
MKSYNGFSPSQRLKALAWLKGEYQSGARRPPVICDSCGQTEGIIDAHSEDYREAFGDHIGRFGLCFACHMMVHVRWSFPQRFHAYAECVASGNRFAPFLERDFQTFRTIFLYDALPERLPSDRATDILLRIEAGEFLPQGVKPRRIPAQQHLGVF